VRRIERSFLSCPNSLLLAFAVIFVVQILSHQLIEKSRDSHYQPLRQPESASWYLQLSSGSTQLMSYLLVLHLQLHDNQLARHILYRKLNYSRLISWLHRIQQINPASDYPAMLAARVYSQTRDKTKLRLLLTAQMEMFQRNPQLNWRWLAESSVIAKHQLGDLDIALQMANLLANQPDEIKMPRWARDIHFLLLGENNRYEDGIIIIRGLLQSGEINDPDEVRFLKEKLSYFQQKAFNLEQ